MKAWVFAAVWAVISASAVFGEETSMVGPDVAAQPEDLIVFSDQIRMGARVVLDADESLAHEVTEPSLLRLEVGFMTDKAAGNQQVRLRCKIRFVAPDKTVGGFQKNDICYEGNLADTAGTWTLLKLKFKFRPQVSDLNGASGVWVQVTDELSDTEKVLMPTYGWMGGKG